MRKNNVVEGIFYPEVPTGHEKKSRKFVQIPRKCQRICPMTVMKNTFPKRKFKLLKNLKDLKNLDFRIYPEIWHLCLSHKLVFLTDAPKGQDFRFFPSHLFKLTTHIRLPLKFYRIYIY